MPAMVFADLFRAGVLIIALAETHAQKRQLKATREQQQRKLAKHTNTCKWYRGHYYLTYTKVGQSGHTHSRRSPGARASTRSGALLSIFEYHGCIALGVAPILMTLPWAHISERFPLPVTRESWQRAAGKGVAREAELRQASDHRLATHQRCM
ncbi:hypothetical protein K456DRAFT_599626 [Colletotrichum gloeosporioides 23]|nr:hypothetical protein K456DRAFT_599626 [Colletotrichum gloeosporioides 23]